MTSTENEGKMRDLGFAFNDKDFSDRILHLEIVADPLDSEPDSDGSDTEPITESLNKKQKTGVLEEKECSTDVEVKTLHINSAILAASSPFFYKLFKNGMRESLQKDATLRINASEEAALMDLLNFIYSNTLSATSVSDLEGVLLIADKFEVKSCMSHCCELLMKRDMSLESAALYLELSSSVLVGEVARSLINEAKKRLSCSFSHVDDLASQKELMTFPPSAIEILLDGIEVESEEDVYKFILKWGRARYPNLEERRENLTKLVGRVLYFPYLHLSTLREIQYSPEFDSKEVSKLILESLYLNAGDPYGKCFYNPPSVGHHHLKRWYLDLPIKAVEFESSPHLVVYFNLPRYECESLFCDSRRYSQEFFLGGQTFAFWVEAELAMGLFVERVCRGDGDGRCVFDYEFRVMKRDEYESVHKAYDCSLSVGERLGLKNLFGVSKKKFLKEYFINEVLHLQVQLTIKNISQH